jgi:hypothetical protein
MVRSCPIVTYLESAMDLKDRYPQHFPVNVAFSSSEWAESFTVLHLFVSVNELLAPYQYFDCASIVLGPFRSSFLDQPKPTMDPQMTMPPLLFRPFNFCEP